MPGLARPHVQLDYQPLSWRVLEPVQFVPGVGGGPGVGEDGQTNTAVVSHVAVLELAEIQTRYQVKQPPELVLSHLEAAEDVEDTGAALIAGCLGQGSVRRLGRQEGGVQR